MLPPKAHVGFKLLSENAQTHHIINYFVKYLFIYKKNISGGTFQYSQVLQKRGLCRMASPTKTRL